MSTFTRFGEEVRLTEARLIPMWFVRRPSEVKAYDTEPQKLPKTAQVEEFQSWHYRGTGKGGRVDRGDRLQGRRWMAGDPVKARRAQLLQFV
jgi:hypothetical protein